MLILTLATLFFTGCTPSFIEKYSEPLKQSVYGVNDSLKEARIDLAWFYSNQTTQLVGPPKNRIKINPIFKRENVVNLKEPVNTVTKNVNLTDGTRVLLLPEQYSKDEAIVVNSQAYNELLKDKKIIELLSNESKEKEKFIKTIQDQIEKDKQVISELLKSYNDAKITIAKKDATIWHRNAFIAFLLLLIGVYIALRVGVAMGKVSLPFII